MLTKRTEYLFNLTDRFFLRTTSLITLKEQCVSYLPMFVVGSFSLSLVHTLISTITLGWEEDTLLLELLKTESAEILRQRQAIEARVTLLRPESIDPDYVDELARKNLFLVKRTDVIVAFSK